MGDSPAVKPQDWSAQCYAEHAAFVPDLGRDLFNWLQPQPGEWILDLGCGDGVLTECLQTLGCSVLGVDASPDMVASAGRRGLQVQRMDGQALTFVGEFDAVFSNAALHWMTRPAAVVEGVWRALRPGGRFVGELGGAGNVAAIQTALHTVLGRWGIAAADLDPWFFPSAETYRACLEAGGFRVEQIHLFERPTPLPTHIRGWLQTFAGPFLAAVPTERTEALVTEVIAALEPQLRQPSGTWVVDYVRLRFAAIKPR